MLCDLLIRSEYWCEEIAKSPDALEDYRRSQVSGVNGASIQFFPAERRGDCWVSSAGTQGVGGRGVATDAVLSRVNCDAPSPVRRTLSDGNQIRIGASKLLPHRFDPAADALEGIASC